jgi:hypothetical protein
VKYAKGTFQTQVEPKGKETITKWEKELNNKCKGKVRDALVQEADWATDLGAMQPRENTLPQNDGDGMDNKADDWKRNIIE